MILHWKIAFTSLKYSFHSNPNSRCFVLVHFQSHNAPNSPPLHISETGYGIMPIGVYALEGQATGRKQRREIQLVYEQ